jgi:hypothetical protein
MRSFVSLIYLSFLLSISLFLISFNYHWTYKFDLEPGVVYSQHDYYFLSTSLSPILLVSSIVPLIISQLPTQTNMVRIACSAATVLLNLGASLLFQHYHYQPATSTDYGLPALLGSLSLQFTFLIFHMVKRYSFLISRGWTEKEKVARRRQAEAD